MSRLEELIQELCPNGVEYKFIAECVQEVKKINWKKDEEGCYQYIDLSSVDREKHKIIETQIINSGNAPSRAQQIIKTCDILFGTTRPLLKRYCFIDAQFDGQICSTGFCVLRADKNIVLPRWIYHNISADAFFSHVEKFQKGASYPAISDSNVKNFKIPVPPLEVQREIVRILDNFTELTAKLTAELTAELTARKKQYEYYRDRLLTFEINYKVGKIIDMLVQPVTDGPHTTPTFVEQGIPFISAEAISEGKIHFEKKRGNITSEFDLECSRKYRPQKGDVFLVKSGSTTGKVGYVCDDKRFNIWSPIAAMRVNSDNSSRFLFHLLQSTPVQRQIKMKSSHGSQPNLSMRALEQFDVVIPPLDVQLRIANVLDNFDAICSDLNIGLPAEIEARQKQYEYYRDALLTFAETGKIIAQTDRQNLIKLVQYVFGFVTLPLNDIANVSIGEFVHKNQQKSDGKYPVFNGGISNTGFYDRYNRTANKIIISARGANAGFVNRVFTDFWSGNSCYTVDVVYDNVNWNFIFYWLKSKEYLLLGEQQKGGIPAVSKKQVESLLCPLPSLKVQNMIVSILDRFDILCNNLTNGLPAEIAARQKQYEYYRDKLLNFKPLEHE